MITMTWHEKTEPDIDVVVVGAGFSGIYAVHLLRERNGLTVQGFERGSDVGGTWYWNRYPGARCDAESVFYSYSFDDAIEQEWTWSERWATQPEILEYLTFVADRLDVRQAYRFDTEVASIEWDDASGLWTTTTAAGDTTTSRFVIAAVGCLSATRAPHFAGMEDFAGAVHHTGAWPHEPVDFSGMRVSIIGTGSSGIQSIPMIAAQAAHVTVFQRTAGFSVPARNRAIGPDESARTKAIYPQLRELARHSSGGTVGAGPVGSALELDARTIRAELEKRWAEGGGGFLKAFTDTLVDTAANAVSADFVRERIRETVADPTVAQLLMPDSHPIGTKRICVDSGYYETFNSPTVELVDIRDAPIERISAAGPVVDGVEYASDAIVLATGFDAMTGPLLRLNVVGRNGYSLADAWQDGPRTYLGLAVAGFPNLFTVTGPGSPSVLSNMVASIEQHIEWISDALAYIVDRGLTVFEADPNAQDAWVDEVNELAEQTLFPTAASWYMGANVPGKPRVFMPYLGGVGRYRRICDDVAAHDYRGFIAGRDPSFDASSLAAQRSNDTDALRSLRP